MSTRITYVFENDPETVVGQIMVELHLPALEPDLEIRPELVHVNVATRPERMATWGPPLELQERATS